MSVEAGMTVEVIKGSWSGHKGTVLQVKTHLTKRAAPLRVLGWAKKQSTPAALVKLQEGPWRELWFHLDKLKPVTN